jgi:hypothetical protein
MTAADRLERIARVIREIEVSDRTAAIIEMQTMVISQTLHTSPDDTADFAELVAKLMKC